MKNVWGRFGVVALGLALSFQLASCAPPRPMNARDVIRAEAASGNVDAEIWMVTDDFWTHEENRQDNSGDLAKLKALADGGHANAQYFLANIYLIGTTRAERDLKKAFDLMNKAAAQKDTRAIIALAEMYGMGVGTRKDGAMAYSYAQKANELDPADGAAAIAHCYKHGWGVTKSESEALVWYGKSANGKSSDGFTGLADAYRDGNGVKADAILAYALFDLAARNTHGYARMLANSDRDKVGLSMLPDDITRAKQLAQQWTPGADLHALRHDARVTNASVSSGGSSSEPSVIHASNPSSNYGKVIGDADLPYIDLASTYDVDIHPDGSEVSLSHLEREIRKQAAIGSLSQIALPYSTTLNTLEITDAYTQKKDGTKIKVDPSAIYEQPVPGTPDVPIYNDLRQKVVVFPNVVQGDTLVLDTRMTNKPMVPGIVSMAMNFSRTYPTRGAIIRVTAPSSMPLQTETHELDFRRYTSGDKTTYEWKFTNLNPLVKEEIGLDPMDRLPRFFLSNAKSYDDVANRYYEEIKSASRVTPKVQQLADKITSGATTPYQQASRLHDWVSRNIRYVAVAFGREAIIPHDADSILNNGYGDCKDHAALLIALLQAKGIPAYFTLINLGESYSLPKPPEIDTFNHAITYIPSLDVFTDTTAGFAPFGVLTFGEYGKPVVIVGAAQPLRHTPVLQPDGTSVNVITTATLDAKGVLKGDTAISATGPYAIALRETASKIEAMGPEQAAASILKSFNKDGDGSFTLPPPYDMAPSYHMSGNFRLVAQPTMLTGNSFFMPSGLNFLVRPGDQLMGPISLQDLTGNEPTPCYGGRVTETIVLTIPQGKQLTRLPKDFAIRNNLLTYTADWSRSGHTITLRRMFHSKSKQAVCIGAARQIAAKSLNDIRGDYNTEISLQ